MTEWKFFVTILKENPKKILMIETLKFMSILYTLYERNYEGAE